MNSTSLWQLHQPFPVPDKGHRKVGLSSHFCTQLETATCRVNPQNKHNLLPLAVHPSCAYLLGYSYVAWFESNGSGDDPRYCLPIIKRETQPLHVMKMSNPPNTALNGDMPIEL